MSLIQNPIIGRAKKQAGGMVFSTVYGQNVMRAKPFQYRDKNSDAQKKYRALFLLIVNLAAALKFYVDLLFITKPLKMSPYSYLVKQLRSAFTYVGSAWVYKPKDIVIGIGTMSAAREWSPTFNHDLSIAVTFDSSIIDTDEKSTDKLYVVITDSTGSKATVLDTGATRADGTAEFEVPDTFSGLSGFCSVGFFVSADGLKNSDVILSTTDTAAVL